ncbi:hypothetical protein B7495_07920 [Cryobacterium sp. LW097]|uniref:hypothetical protein n=1 Tax=unclassified Cryobacterium TaxID=2649013 RepID=UPI000B4CF8FE|nr:MULTISPECIES: hypothetical protein [unclassified Cryobacterium]ASD22027.1 hypothetical protein B7495_07920 [Cryobacterium sp. LW097]TFC53399.1 hypothetical protein E3O68_11610 [Cryobacterium sp. TMB3-1-2]TFC62027.1 hypothetical protein E3O60_03055 [Cryobacterium sp. TMB1-7]TFC69064.1 hypothetical protein E3T21_12595 [Cryobacterium sp. TMB3-15]TFC76136.1 hypothetical protein E3T22_09220 [Cryobacterium sp. TMB3-10]
MTSEQTGPVKPSAWRHQARFLGGAFAVAAAVIAVGLWSAPAVTAYEGLNPWVFAGLLGFILVLTGACVLFAASLPTAPPNTAPSTAALSITAPSITAPAATPPATEAAAQPAAQPAAHPAAHTAAPRRGLTILGSVFGVVGLALAALAVVLTVLLPMPTQRIMVQFTDLYGRVQLEYCPSLPASFAATASRADLAGSSTILPVKVSGDICGDPEFTDGVWIYLNRSSVTVSGQP